MPSLLVCKLFGLPIKATAEASPGAGHMLLPINIEKQLVYVGALVMFKDLVCVGGGGGRSLVISADAAKNRALTYAWLQRVLITNNESPIRFLPVLN
jgi:hypothetical protein